MARLLAAVVLAVLASAAFAQTCPTVTSNIFSKPTSACVGYTNCELQLCSCGGLSTPTTPLCLGNLSTTTANCTVITNCFGAFVRCLSTLSNTARTNTSNPCNLWAVTLHTAVLAVAATTFGNSQLQLACAAEACRLRNVTSRLSCDMGGVNFTNVCSFENVVGANATGTPTSVTGSASGASMVVVAVLAVIAALL